MKRIRRIFLIILCILALAAGTIGVSAWRNSRGFAETAVYFLRLLTGTEEVQGIFVSPDLKDLPPWDGKTIAVPVNHNVPLFSEEDRNLPEGTVRYSSLDELGRCGSVTASLCAADLPENPRDDEESRMTIIPTGYQQTEYPEELVEHRFLYHRCHLLGWQLGGETSGRNLIAGTRAFNIEGMLPYENQAARYLYSHRSHHILYRVTPVFAGSERSCRGVLMEGLSPEDPGELSFCVFIYNEQPGIVIDHWDGSSRIQPEEG
ncbi:MAG: DNA/RNA non-specific endonuclease [Parasporobacterium sp.]|nr:DNA/RNA non-specific endonuclease [Parasporobacterium sp.]